MSTLNGSVWSRCSIELTYPARSYYQRTLNREDGTGVGMNVVVYLEKEKNEETKTGKRKAGEQGTQATDFKEAAGCPSAIVQKATKKWLS